jgi:hypothetical protein
MQTRSSYLAALLLSLTAPVAFADQLADPTRPATAKAVVTTTADTLKVEAVMNSNGRPLAIVNGRVVRAGDSVGTARIEEVLSNGVRFKRDGRIQIAYVGKQVMQVRHNVTAHEDRT